MTGRVVVRRTRYRGEDGYLVRHYVLPGVGHYAPGVFVLTLEDAERCRECFKAGETPSLREDGTWGFPR